MGLGPIGRNFSLQTAGKLKAQSEENAKKNIKIDRDEDGRAVFKTEELWDAQKELLEDAVEKGGFYIEG